MEVPPPGDGLITVIWAVPGVVISLAGITACNCVLLTNVVVLLVPFQRTTEDATKFSPAAVNVNPAPPVIALLGEREPSTGEGLAPVPVTARDKLPPFDMKLTFPVKTAAPVGVKRTTTA